MAWTGDWHNDFNNTDKFDCTSTIINRRNDVKQSEKIYQQSTEPERELKKSNEDYNNETHLLIRIFSIDYKVINSDTIFLKWYYRYCKDSYFVFNFKYRCLS